MFLCHCLSAILKDTLKAKKNCHSSWTPVIYTCKRDNAHSALLTFSHRSMSQPRVSSQLRGDFCNVSCSVACGEDPRSRVVVADSPAIITFII